MGTKVSIIMAAYNCEDTVGDSVASILQQTFSDWEFIICDDGSSDRTFEILQDYQNADPRIKVIRNAVNSKLPYSLNHCLQYARGTYIARMDADDRSHPERLEKQVAFLDAHPELDVVGTGMTCFCGDEITGVRHPPETPGPEWIGLGVPFFHATILMRRQVYERLGGYSLAPHVLRCEDVDLWMRFFAAGFRGANLQEPLYYVREDLAAARRRSLKNAVNATKTLWYGFRTYHYPAKQYVYLAKPIVSVLIPQRIKYWINQKRWRTQPGDQK